MATAIDFSEAPRSIAIGLGALLGVYFKDSIPGPDWIDAAVGAIIGAKAYDWSNGDTSMSIPMDTGALAGAVAAAGAVMYPMGFQLELAVPVAAAAGDFLGNMYG